MLLTCKVSTATGW